jgi:hypothetical protein
MNLEDLRVKLCWRRRALRGAERDASILEAGASAEVK